MRCSRNTRHTITGAFQAPLQIGGNKTFIFYNYDAMFAGIHIFLRLFRD